MKKYSDFSCLVFIPSARVCDVFLLDLSSVFEVAGFSFVPVLITGRFCSPRKLARICSLFTFCCSLLVLVPARVPGFLHRSAMSRARGVVRR
jgi:hypothetical protein